MKHLFSIILAVCLFISCSDKPPADPMVSDIKANKIDSLPADHTQEAGEYRNRLSQRLGEIEIDMESLSQKKQAERNAEKLKAYDLEIEKKGKLKTDMKEKLDRFEEKSRENWQQFKRELDELFDRDGKDDK